MEELTKNEYNRHDLTIKLSKIGIGRAEQTVGRACKKLMNLGLIDLAHGRGYFLTQKGRTMLSDVIALNAKKIETKKSTPDDAF